MSTFTVETAHIGLGCNESLAQKLAQGVFTLSHALVCATDIASQLRDYHHKGLAHGNVTTRSIRLTESGAMLMPRICRVPSIDDRSDVSAFGAAFYEMLTGQEPPSEFPAADSKPVRQIADIRDVWKHAIRLAERCIEDLADISQVVIELRILGLLNRGLTASPRCLQVAARSATGTRQVRRLQLVPKPAQVELQSPPADSLGEDTVVPQPHRLQVVAKPAPVGDVPERQPKLF
jgi:hypothetical protein